MKNRKTLKKYSLEDDSISLGDTYEFIFNGWKTIISCIFLSFLALQLTNYLWPERNQSGKMYIYLDTINLRDTNNFMEDYMNKIISPDFFSEEDFSLCGTNFINFSGQNSFLIVKLENKKLISVESKNFNSDLVEKCLNSLKSSIEEKTPLFVNSFIDRYQRELITISESYGIKNFQINVLGNSRYSSILADLNYLNYVNDDLKISSIFLYPPKVIHISIFIYSFIMGFFLGILILINKHRRY